VDTITTTKEAVVHGGYRLQGEITLQQKQNFEIHFTFANPIGE
jgi:hypothetical protein